MPEPLHIGTDGSAIGNPGPTGWAWVAEDGRFETGGEPRSTNNVAELTAIQRAVAAHPDHPLLVSTDSQYAMNCIVQWGPNWIKRGDSSKANFALIVAIIEAIRARPAGAGVEIQWVRSHQEDNRYPLNTAADELANAAGMRSKRRQDPVSSGVHEIDWTRREVAPSPSRSGKKGRGKGSPWQNQGQIGKAHGLTARQVGVVLEKAGLKVGSEGTQKAYDEGFAQPFTMKDGTKIARWSPEKFASLVSD